MAESERFHGLMVDALFMFSPNRPSLIRFGLNVDVRFTEKTCGPRLVIPDSPLGHPAMGLVLLSA